MTSLFRSKVFKMMLKSDPRENRFNLLINNMLHNFLTIYVILS